ncbi:hypothetical protein KJ632_00255, partial [Patescibacteria group bacterium]|nr:hypothetical protein [Patescibacteria group bacterium]
MITKYISKSAVTIITILGFMVLMIGGTVLAADDSIAPPSFTIGDDFFDDISDPEPAPEDTTAPAEEFQCADGIDNDADGEIDYPADPGCSNADDNNETDPIGDIEIVSSDVFPKGINPLIQDTTITYELASSTLIKITIVDQGGVTKRVLVDDEEMAGGEEH